MLLFGGCQGGSDKGKDIDYNPKDILLTIYPIKWRLGIEGRISFQAKKLHWHPNWEIPSVCILFHCDILLMSDDLDSYLIGWNLPRISENVNWMRQNEVDSNNKEFNRMKIPIKLTILCLFLLMRNNPTQEKGPLSMGEGCFITDMPNIWNFPFCGVKFVPYHVVHWWWKLNEFSSNYWIWITVKIHKRPIFGALLCTQNRFG